MPSSTTRFHISQPLATATWLRLGLSAAVLTAALLLAPRFLSDFAQDYAAARGWWQGQSTNAPTAQLLAECCGAIAPFYGGMQTAHPPFATLLALPIALLPWPAARAIWLLLSAAAIAGAWQIRRVPLALCAATGCFWVIALGLGTHEPLMFLLLALALTLEPRAPRLAGALVGLCAAIKIYPALLILGLLASGRRGMALAAMLAGATAAALAEVVLDFGVTLGWMRFVPINTLHYVDEIGNDSLVRLVRVIAPGASPTLVALVVVALLVLPLLPRIRGGAWLGPLIPVMLLGSPLSWRHYMGLVALDEPGWIELVALGVSGVVAILIGVQLLPPDNMAPIVQGPLLLVLVWMWYRHARPITSPAPLE
jgi:hypothetical protein